MFKFMNDLKKIEIGSSFDLLQQASKLDLRRWETGFDIDFYTSLFKNAMPTLPQSAPRGHRFKLTGTRSPGCNFWLMVENFCYKNAFKEYY
ncbi:hypothetical protein BpHYR1_007928 [Brachionus plicatilis]|uniref:Uncharacterized protein n=1 Tax=Brachionus plicatilis TaxID=10195 RepID=A0A3M7QB19_BRAPC|nr:hypothetical protein BpHYR1_007928 [Brachionus plicatilis]